MTPLISVIIPKLNEARAWPAALLIDARTVEPRVLRVHPVIGARR